MFNINVSTEWLINPQISELLLLLSYCSLLIPYQHSILLKYHALPIYFWIFMQFYLEKL
jgi:hypothetical protein